MVKISRSSLVRTFCSLFGIQEAAGTITETGNNIIPVVEVGQKTSSFARYGLGATTATFTIFTASAVNETFITAIHLSLTKDIVCDLTNPYLEITAETGGAVFLVIPVPTLTAESRTIDLALPYPLKLKKGSLVRIIGAFTAGTCTKSGMIFGYEQEA